MSVPLGGFLFEYFMYTTSSYVNNREWNSVCNNMDADTIDEHVQHQLISKNINSFIGWLLFTIGRIGSNGNKQLFFITFTSTYYGLSRDGIDALYRYGYGVSLSVYDDMKRDSEHTAVNDMRLDTHMLLIHIRTVFVSIDHT